MFISRPLKVVSFENNLAICFKNFIWERGTLLASVRNDETALIRSQKRQKMTVITKLFPIFFPVDLLAPKNTKKQKPRVIKIKIISTVYSIKQYFLLFGHINEFGFQV